MAANQPAYMVVNMERDGIDSKKVRTSSSWIMCLGQADRCPWSSNAHS